jgi:8-oxo-dGTP diphosphatase
MVAGAVIEGPEGVLLVANRRRNGEIDWTTPGGVVDPGESVLEGLTREVLEETGLTVHSWEGPLYEIETVAPDLGWHLRVEVHRALEVTGDLVVDDPDGIVVDACWVPGGDCAPRLVASHPWVREPLSAWIGERWEGSRSYRYRVTGTDMRSLEVTVEP